MLVIDSRWQPVNSEAAGTNDEGSSITTHPADCTDPLPGPSESCRRLALPALGRASVCRPAVLRTAGRVCTVSPTSSRRPAPVRYQLVGIVPLPGGWIRAGGTACPVVERPHWSWTGLSTTVTKEPAEPAPPESRSASQAGSRQLPGDCTNWVGSRQEPGRGRQIPRARPVADGFIARGGPVALEAFHPASQCAPDSGRGRQPGRPPERESSRQVGSARGLLHRMTRSRPRSPPAMRVGSPGETRCS